MRASRQLDNQVPATDNDAHHLLDSSQKIVSLTKKRSITFHFKKAMQRVDKHHLLSIKNFFGLF
jgi:hypothetical protein